MRGIKVIFTVLDYKNDKKLLEVQYLKDNKIKYAYSVYKEGEYEITKNKLIEFIKKEPSN